jgi:hypothetical protein
MVVDADGKEWRAILRNTGTVITVIGKKISTRD